MQPEYSREYDLEALRAFDEKYPEYAFDPFLCPELEATGQKAVQVGESPEDGQVQLCPSDEKIQWVDKNDYFNDQDVASIFENAVAGIESAIIESSIINNHQVDLSGNTQVALSDWALGTNRQKNAGLDSQEEFPYDFNSFEQEHWDFYTNEILKDETLMTKSWDDLICWLSESWIKYKAEDKENKASKASQEHPCVDQGHTVQGSKNAPQKSESRSQLGKGRAQYPMSPPERTGTNNAAPSPYQNSNARGGNPQVSSVGNNHHMSSQKTPSHPGIGMKSQERLHHSQPHLNGRTRPLQGSVQQVYDPRTQYQQPHGPPNGNINSSQAATPSRHQGAVQGMNGAPRPQRQQPHGPSNGHTNNSHSTPPVHPQALAQGGNGTLMPQRQQSHGLNGHTNNSHSIPPVHPQALAQGMNATPRAPIQQQHNPPIGYVSNSQSTPPVMHQGYAQGTNGAPRAQHQQLRGPPTGSANTIQSGPPVRQQGFAPGMNGALTNQLSTLGPGGRTDRQVPRQILGRRGREATKDDDDVVELDPSVCTSKFSEDGSRSKRQRINANPSTSMEPRPERRPNGRTPRPQYYGAAGAPVPIKLPEELSRNTEGFVGDAMRPCVPQKAINSNGSLVSSTQGTHTLIQAASNVRPSPTNQAGHDDVAARRISGGRSTSQVSGNYLGSLQHIPVAHQTQQISGKPSREEPVGRLRKGNNETQQANEMKGQGEGNGDRRKHVQHEQNPAPGPPQVSSGGPSHPPAFIQPSCLQLPGKILGEVLDDLDSEPEGDAPPIISRKRNRSPQ